MTEIFFPPRKVRHIRITQTGSVNNKFWSVHELEIYRHPESVPAAAYVRKLKTASEFE